MRCESDGRCELCSTVSVHEPVHGKEVTLRWQCGVMPVNSTSSLLRELGFPNSSTPPILH